MRRFNVARLLGISAVFVALFVVPASPAHADNGAPSAPAQAAAIMIPGTDQDGDPSTLSSCAVTVYGYTGYRICEFVWSYLPHPDGTIEYFVVGTNYAIFHIWPGSGGWHSLGGQARAATPNGAYSYYYGVSTVGTNNLLYCRDWPWTFGWYTC